MHQMHAVDGWQLIVDTTAEPIVFPPPVINKYSLLAATKRAPLAISLTNESGLEVQHFPKPITGNLPIFITLYRQFTLPKYK